MKAIAKNDCLVAFNGAIVSKVKKGEEFTGEKAVFLVGRDLAELVKENKEMPKPKKKETPKPANKKPAQPEQQG